MTSCPWWPHARPHILLSQPGPLRAAPSVPWAASRLSSISTRGRCRPPPQPDSHTLRLWHGFSHRQQAASAQAPVITLVPLHIRRTSARCVCFCCSTAARLHSFCCVQARPMCNAISAILPPLLVSALNCFCSPLLFTGQFLAAHCCKLAAHCAVSLLPVALLGC